MKIAGVCLATSVANTNWVPVRVGFPVRVMAMSVKGESDAGANEAVAIGDTVFLDSDGELNRDEVNGTPWGMALSTVAGDGSTTVIPVLLFPFGGLANA